MVDTRKATNVNLDKYDEKLQDMADRSGRAGGGRRDRDQSKEKFRNAGSKKRGQMSFSSKRKQEEAEKMRRLQLEIAKKTPLTVKIPDEISVAWPTWPITTTMGARGTRSSGRSSAVSMSFSSMVTTTSRSTLQPISSAVMAAVSKSMI